MAVISCNPPCSAKDEREIVERLKELNGGECDLISLIMSGCCGTVRQYFENGADVNAKIGHTPPLYAALCVENNTAMANMLLDLGADANAGYPGRQTAISAACVYSGNESVVQRMVDSGAKGLVEAVIEAIKNGFPEYLDILLPRLPDVNNATDCFGEPVDFLSVKPHSRYITTFLTQHGVRPKIPAATAAGQ